AIASPSGGFGAVAASTSCSARWPISVRISGAGGFSQMLTATPASAANRATSTILAFWPMSGRFRRGIDQRLADDVGGQHGGQDPPLAAAAGEHHVQRYA